MRLLPARRETAREPDCEADTGDQTPEQQEPCPQARGREFVRRVADAASAAHREHVPF